MNNNSSLEIKGIKCDYCDYQDWSVKYEDYKSYIDKPCPCCGANLLTKKDYRACKILVGVVKVLDFIFPKKESDDNVKVRLDFNGSGKITVSDIERCSEKDKED